IVSAGLFISIALHVVPFGGLLAWSSAAPEIPEPIPVQLVVEQPPPPPPPEQKAPPPGPLASEDTGKMASPPDTVVATPDPRPAPPRRPAAGTKRTQARRGAATAAEAQAKTQGGSCGREACAEAGSGDTAAAAAPGARAAKPGRAVQQCDEGY